MGLIQNLLFDNNQVEAHPCPIDFNDKFTIDMWNGNIPAGYGYKLLNGSYQKDGNSGVVMLIPMEINYFIVI